VKSASIVFPVMALDMQMVAVPATSTRVATAMVKVSFTVLLLEDYVATHLDGRVLCR
jgi:hypothetical protein